MFENNFVLSTDNSRCTSVLTGSALVNGLFDTWFYANHLFESGKVYGLISEYGQGCMYLSYLMGGKVEFDRLRIFCNNSEISRTDLEKVSWNIEPSNEFYRGYKVEKAIRKALSKNNSGEEFNEVAERFFLTPERYDRKLRHLSGERWRASSALGYANGKKIFYAPYMTSSFYRQVCCTITAKIFDELRKIGAIVFLPAGSDSVIKYIADECVYIDPVYNEQEIQNYMEEWKNERF